MTDKFDLPGDHWVELKDPTDVTERERRPLRRDFLAVSRVGAAAAPEVGSVAAVGAINPLSAAPAPAAAVPTISDEKLDAADDFELRVMAFFIESWDFDGPVTEDALLDLPSPVYEALDGEVSSRFQALFPRLFGGKKDSGSYDALTLLTLKRQGHDMDGCPEWADETFELHDLIEFTHWTIEEIDRTPAVVIERLLLAHKATHNARSAE